MVDGGTQHILKASKPTSLKTYPFIRVEGNRFIDDDGNAVNFRGVNISDPDWQSH
jgi:hypothetical protein